MTLLDLLGFSPAEGLCVPLGYMYRRGTPRGRWSLTENGDIMSHNTSGIQTLAALRVKVS